MGSKVKERSYNCIIIDKPFITEFIGCPSCGVEQELRLSVVGVQRFVCIGCGGAIFVATQIYTDKEV